MFNLFLTVFMCVFVLSTAALAEDKKAVENKAEKQAAIVVVKEATAQPDIDTTRPVVETTAGEPLEY